MNKDKRSLIITIAAVTVIILCGLTAAIRMGTSAPTYDGRDVDVIGLYEDPSSYDNSSADGIAAVIVNENNERTVADNSVFSIVFNFRGYDTLGESFILIGALAGCLVILRKTGKKAAPETEGKEVTAK